MAGLADDLYDVIGLLRRRSRRLVGAPLPELALSGAQLELLRVVRRNPGITVAESARVLGLAANTVSTLVGQLLALGVLVRERDSSDRRVARLDLTPSARAGLEQWRDRRAQSTAVALAELPAADRARPGCGAADHRPHRREPAGDARRRGAAHLRAGRHRGRGARPPGRVGCRRPTMTRPSTSGAWATASGRTARSMTSPWPSSRVSASACSGPTGPARRRRSGCSTPCCRCRPGRSRSSAARCAPRRWPCGGCSATCPSSCRSRALSRVARTSSGSPVSSTSPGASAGLASTRCSTWSTCAATSHASPRPTPAAW